MFSFLILLITWAVWSFGLKRALVDGFKQRIFEIRDEMFDYAADGNIDFNHPAYGTLRTLMNGYIRFAGKITLLGLLLTFLFERKRVEREGRAFTDRLNGEIDLLSPEVQKVILKYFERMSTEVGKHILRTSPLLLILLAPFVPVILAVALISESVEKWTTGAEHTLDPIAFQEAKRVAA